MLNTEIYSLLVNNKPYAKIHVTLDDDKRYHAKVLSFGNRNRLLQSPKESRISPIQNVQIFDATIEGVLEQITNWAEDKFGEDFVLKK